MAQPASSSKRPATWGAVTVLLSVAILGTLWVPIYARSMPELGPFPFFYWYQLIWVPLTAVILWICYLLLRTKPTRGPAGATERAEMNHVNVVAFVIVFGCVPDRHPGRVRLGPVASGRGPDAPERVGPRRPRDSGPSSAGSCSAATSTPPTRSSPCRRWCTPPARPGSTRCRTRSWSSRSCSSSCPRLWSVARARGYVTPGEFVRGRHGSQGLGLAVAATGILATMPYIALQLVGIESVLTVMGIGSTSGNAFIRDLPLIIAFGVVAAYTYLAGLRAPALIAFVKDILIYVTVIVAMLYIPSRLGGWGHIFGVASAHLNTVNPATGKPYGSIVVMPAGEWAYATLALGSALALFVYPHATTGVFAAKRRDVIRRNAAMLPAYSLVLGLIALFGYMARAVPAVNAASRRAAATPSCPCRCCSRTCSRAGSPGSATRRSSSARSCPRPSCRSPQRTCSPATFTRSSSGPTPPRAEETRVARLASLVMKVGALGFALELNKTFSINLQLLGGIWILQTFPAIVVGLYTRWFHRFALIIGWAAGMAYGTIEAWRTPGGGQAHFGASVTPVLGHTTYIAIAALIINLVVTALLTLVFHKFGLQDGYDETRPADTGRPRDRAPRRARAQHPRLRQDSVAGTVAGRL